MPDAGSFDTQLQFPLFDTQLPAADTEVCHAAEVAPQHAVCLRNIRKLDMVVGRHQSAHLLRQIHVMLLHT